MSRQARKGVVRKEGTHHARQASRRVGRREGGREGGWRWVVNRQAGTQAENREQGTRGHINSWLFLTVLVKAPPSDQLTRELCHPLCSRAVGAAICGCLQAGDKHKVELSRRSDGELEHCHVGAGCHGVSQSEGLGGPVLRRESVEGGKRVGGREVM